MAEAELTMEAEMETPDLKLIQSNSVNREVEEFKKMLDEITAKQETGLEEPMDIYEYFVEEARKKRLKKEDIRTAYFIGNAYSGKSSLILSFLERTDTPNRTIALDFCFAQRLSNNMTKEVCHIWELGGELTENTGLLGMPIVHCHVLDKLSVFLILDLSEPKKIWSALETAVINAKNALREALTEMPKSEVMTLTQQLEKNISKRLGSALQEKEFLDPFPFPLVIIGTKYDLFQDLDPETRKTVCRVLRLAAHRLGASLNYYSKDDVALKRRYREIVSHYAFKTPFPKATCHDFNKPLMIPPGGDSYESIWPGQNPSQFTLEYCRRHFETKIGKPEEKTKIIYDPATDPKYAEPDIDRKRDEYLTRITKANKVSQAFAEEPNQVI